MVETLLRYWRWVLGPERLAAIEKTEQWLVTTGTITISAAVLLTVADSARRREWAPLFFLGWFFVVIGPVLPLRDHFSDYYLALPSLGIAGVLATGLVTSGRAVRTVAALAAVIFAAANLPVVQAHTRSLYERGLAVRKVVLGVRAARELHPRKVILLEGVTDELYWTAVYDNAFRAAGVERVYLTPESESEITYDPERNVRDYILPQALTLRALRRDEAVVYTTRGPVLRNITYRYAADAASTWKPATPKRIDLGDPLFEEQTGTGWYDAETGHRWMGKKAFVHIGGPKAGEKIHLSFFCPAQLALPQSPLLVRVFAGGDLVGELEVKTEGMQTAVVTPAAAVPDGREIEVGIEVNRTFAPSGEDRQLGLAFGRIEVR
jgi:hypothetical protein